MTTQGNRSIENNVRGKFYQIADLVRKKRLQVTTEKPAVYSKGDQKQ